MLQSGLAMPALASLNPWNPLYSSLEKPLISTGMPPQFMELLRQVGEQPMKCFARGSDSTNAIFILVIALLKLIYRLYG